MNDVQTKETSSNGLSWLSVLLAVIGAAAYMVLIDVPFLRRTGLVSFGLFGLATVLGILGARRGPKAWPWIGPALGVLMGVGLAYYLFIFAILPQSQGLDSLAVAPNFTTLDHTGTPVTLYETLASGPVLLVFYRGYW
jgi:hypothetical protein